MRYDEILMEGRDAPLYHGTSLFGVLNILSKNCIEAKTHHDDTKLLLGTEDNEIKGVSLSRDLQLPFIFGNYVFQIDQRKLAQTHKIVPIDYWSKESTPIRGKPFSAKHQTYEYEEFCVGAIKPLERYLTALIMREKDLVITYLAKQSPTRALNGAKASGYASV